MKPLPIMFFLGWIMGFSQPDVAKKNKTLDRPYYAGIHVTQAVMSEYVNAYLYSDSTVWAYVFTGSVVFQPYSFSGRKIVMVAPGFNQWINLDDQGYVWRTDLSATTGTRITVDRVGN